MKFRSRRRGFVPDPAVQDLPSLPARSTRSSTLRSATRLMSAASSIQCVQDFTLPPANNYFVKREDEEEEEEEEEPLRDRLRNKHNPSRIPRS